MPRHIFLVGLSGSGKSTVGAIAATSLGAPFVDVDAVIAQRAGRTVAQIFEVDGEAAFRALEAAVAGEILDGPASVVASGGGTFEDAEVRRRSLENALVVYLETTPGVAAARLTGVQDRPLLQGAGADKAARLRQMLDRRGKGYAEAHERVTTDGLSPDQVAGQVVALARKRGGW